MNRIRGVEIIDKVTSQCAECGTSLPADVVERDGRVYQQRNCPDHGSQEFLIFSDSDLYRKLDGWNRLIFPGSDGDHGSEAAMPTLAVMDITNRCNFRCPICFAESNGHGRSYFLDPTLIRRMLESLVSRATPCQHIQFSGGEPTLHPEFPAILRSARELGFTHIQVASNGSRMIDADYVKLCEDSGLHTIYLQFDGIDDEVYIKLRGQRLLEKKIRAVENVAKTNMRLVLVPTIESSVNVDQIGPIFSFALQYSKHVTGISFQPSAHVGRVELPQGDVEPFNLAVMAREFSAQTGLTRFPDDWFPLSAVSLISRAINRFRRDGSIAAACDAHCSLGTYFYIGDDNKPLCVNHFLDLERFFRDLSRVAPHVGFGGLGRRISQIQEMSRLAQCFNSEKAPEGLTFQRLLRGLDGWEDKSVGRSADWSRTGFNGMFVAGMHFMDGRTYNHRRLQRCIIQYVTTSGDLIPFCSYNAGARLRTAEEAVRIGQDRLPQSAPLDRPN
ncbi:MAG: radical SAM protein [Chloroflexi bacterium]|nr:radical SAM protein [Chloroflexota bacterium]